MATYTINVVLVNTTSVRLVLTDVTADPEVQVVLAEPPGTGTTSAAYTTTEETIAFRLSASNPSSATIQVHPTLGTYTVNNVDQTVTFEPLRSAAYDLTMQSGIAIVGATEVTLRCGLHNPAGVPAGQAIACGDTIPDRQPYLRLQSGVQAVSLVTSAVAAEDALKPPLCPGVEAP